MATAPEQEPRRYFDKAFFRWLSHYMPVCVAVAMGILALVLNFGTECLKNSSALPSLSPQKVATDANFALLSFWAWAVITNVHDGRMVRTSGRDRPADPLDREREAGLLYLLTFVAVVLYVVTWFPRSNGLAVGLTLAALLLPGLALWNPLPDQ